MVDHDPGDDVVRVDRPDSEGQFELLVDFLRHRTFSIGRGERALSDAAGPVGVGEALVLEDAPDPLPHRVDLGFDFLRVGETLRGLE